MARDDREEGFSRRTDDRVARGAVGRAEDREDGEDLPRLNVGLIGDPREGDESEHGDDGDDAQCEGDPEVLDEFGGDEELDEEGRELCVEVELCEEGDALFEFVGALGDDFRLGEVDEC